MGGPQPLAVEQFRYWGPYLEGIWIAGPVLGGRHPVCSDEVFQALWSCELDRRYDLAVELPCLEELVGLKDP